MAGFGFSISDILAVGNFAWNIYKSCKNAGRDFREIAQDVNMLHVVLHELGDEAGNPTSLIHRAGAGQHKEFRTLMRSCKTNLQEVERAVANYNSLQTINPQLRHRLAFTEARKVELKTKLSADADRLNLFLTSLHTGSLGRIEASTESHTRVLAEIRAKLETVHEDILAGRKDAGLLSVIDWGSLEKELVDDTISEVDIELNKHVIGEWLADINSNLGGREEGLESPMTAEGSPAPERLAISTTSQQPAIATTKQYQPTVNHAERDDSNVKVKEEPNGNQLRVCAGRAIGQLNGETHLVIREMTPRQRIDEDENEGGSGSGDSMIVHGLQRITRNHLHFSNRKRGNSGSGRRRCMGPVTRQSASYSPISIQEELPVNQHTSSPWQGDASTNGATVGEQQYPSSDPRYLMYTVSDKELSQTLHLGVIGVPDSAKKLARAPTLPNGWVTELDTRTGLYYFVHPPTQFAISAHPNTPLLLDVINPAGWTIPDIPPRPFDNDPNPTSFEIIPPLTSPPSPPHAQKLAPNYRASLPPPAPVPLSPPALTHTALPSTAEAAVIKRTLVVTLEDLFWGAEKKLKLRYGKSCNASGGREGKEWEAHFTIDPGTTTQGECKNQPRCKLHLVDHETEKETTVTHVHVFLEEEPHKLFTREGNNLRHTIELNLLEALNGWKRTIRTIDGERLPVKHKGPTPLSWQHRFVGLGLPRTDNPKLRGDFFVGISLKMPLALTIRQRTILENVL